MYCRCFHAGKGLSEIRSKGTHEEATLSLCWSLKMNTFYVVYSLLAIVSDHGCNELRFATLTTIARVPLYSLHITWLSQDDPVLA